MTWSLSSPVLLLVLPESRHLPFDCGVKVQLGFAAEFSNIMIIYTRILDQPQDLISCNAQLSDFSEVRVCWFVSRYKQLFTELVICGIQAQNIFLTTALLAVYNFN